MARSTHIVVTAVWRALAFFVVWLAIDDNVSEPELLTGVGVAILATALVSLADRARSVHARWQRSMLRYAYRPLILLVTDSVRVCLVLFRSIVLRRPVESRFRAVRYRATDAKETDVARRVLTEWSASLAPNRYAIGIDTQNDLLLVHELTETEGSVDPLELG